MKIRSGGGHLPELVGGVVLAPHLPGLGLHPSLALWLAFPPLPGHGGHSGHLPELVGGVVLAPHILGLGLPLVHPGGGHLPELGHGGRGQQCWTDWAWVCSAGWYHYWSGASCGESSPRQTPHLLGLGLHPSLALWLACPLVRGHGGHLPQLVGGVVLAPLLHGLVLHPAQVY